MDSRLTFADRAKLAGLSVLPNSAAARLWPNAFSGKSAERIWRYMFTDQDRGGITNHFTDYESYLKAVTSISWVYSCVSVIAYNVAKNDWELVKRGTDEVIDPLKHPYGQLLLHPNDRQTQFELDEEAVFHMLLTGNIFEAHDEVNAKWQPSKIYNLRPSRVKIMPERDKATAGYVYQVNNVKIPFEPMEMLHTKLPHPHDDLYGLGVIEAGQNTFNTELHQQLSMLAFFANMAQPSGIMRATGDISPDDWEMVKKGWNAAHGKSKDRYKTAFLKGPLEYQQIAQGPSEYGQTELSQDSRDRIIALFGVPLSKLGMRETSAVKDDSEDRFFYNETIEPILSRREDRRNWWLPQVGWGDIEFRYKRNRFEDAVKTSEVAKNKGATYSYTRNELRSINGDPPLKTGGNVIVMPMAMAEVEVEVDEPVKTVSAPGAKGKAKRRLIQGLIKHRQALEKQTIKEFEPKISAFFKGQSKRVIEAAGAIKKKSDLTVEKIWSGDKEDEALVKAIEPLHRFVIDQTVTHLVEVLGKQKKRVEPGLFPSDWDFPNLDKFVGSLAKQVVRVNKTTKDDIAGQLETGFDRGYSVYQVVHGVEGEDYNGILGVFEKASSYRAEMIARTETMNVYQQASLETYKSVGMDKVEIADGLLPTSDADCQARNGQIWTIEKAQAFEDHPNGSFVTIPYFKE